MSTEVAKAQNTAVSTDVADPFGYQGSEGAQGTTYMKFTGATGRFSAGADDEEIEHGSTFAANMMGARYEWQFWWDSEMMESVSATIVEDPSLYDRRPDWLPEDPEGIIDLSLEEIEERQADMDNTNNDGWTCAAVLPLRGLEGTMGEDPLTGEEFTLKLNRGVAMNSFHSLRKSFGRQYKFKQGLTPVVELDVNSYEPRSKKAGKKRYAPVIKIVDWKDESELMAMVGESTEGYDGDAPQIEHEPEKTEEAQPRRRGRRGANYG